MQKSCRGKHDKPRSTYGLWHWVGACRLATRCPADETPARPLFTRLRGGLHWPCSPANGFKPFAQEHERQGQYGVPAVGHAQTGSPRGSAPPEGKPPGSRPEGPMGLTSHMAPPLRGNARSFSAADAAAVGQGSDLTACGCRGAKLIPVRLKMTTAFLRLAPARLLMTVCPEASEALATMRTGARPTPGAG